ncbi:MAG TPA: tryptophan synthase subunit alpha [Saprospiraceae bacterium]|nr:tryptophan synthase subunit alpha [Saprospiraceae bacterium]HNT22700.1 tryptophan synthase subunit alpha [Saprospiraceae bacterium]
MSRLFDLFARKQGGILNIYFTAGFPGLEDTVPIIKALSDAGADLVEIGIPYSDPLADGPTIQASGQAALKNGMTLDLLFRQVAQARAYTSMPFILMGYFNQVLQFGEENFLSRAKESGVDALILPDLPVEEYELHYRSLFGKYGMDIAFLITPQTPEARIRHIDQVSNSFIYMVSSNAITGAKAGIDDYQEAYFRRISAMGLKNPRLIGFGISNKATFDQACRFAQGAIIGSAFINALAGSKDLASTVSQFIGQVRQG